jgi:cytochrome c-type biogenesis protein CcmH
MIELGQGVRDSSDAISASAIPNVSREDLSGGRVTRSLAMVFFLIASIATTAFAQSAKTQLRDPVQAKRFNEISDRLVCQCGCNMVLRVCNHQNCPSAIPMRHEIEKQIGEGKDNDAIVASFVEKDGLKVLSTPPAKGFDLAAWVMPGFALGVGLFAAWYFAVRWASKRKLAVAGGNAAPVDPILRARIEDELKG